jgi:hypothetical protein
MPDERGRSLPEDINFPNALTSFSGEEQARLVRYAVRAQRLSDCSFFNSGQGRTAVNSRVDKPTTVEMPHADDADDEVIDAMFQRLRILYAPGRLSSASFTRTVQLLRIHARAKGTEDSRVLLKLLDELVETEKQVVEAGGGIGRVVETRGSDGSLVSCTTPAREVFEDWLYGEHLRDDESQLVRIETFRDVRVHHLEALAVASCLASFYVSVARWLLPHILNASELFQPPLENAPAASARAETT